MKKKMDYSGLRRIFRNAWSSAKDKLYHPDISVMDGDISTQMDDDILFDGDVHITSLPNPHKMKKDE